MTSRSIEFSLKPSFLVLCFALVLAAIPAIAQTPALQPRITAPIDDSSRSTLTGSRSPRANSADDAGAVSPSMQLQGISLVFSRTAAQQTALDTLVAAQQNPTSPLYHHWLTPAQYAAQFGVSDADIAAVETWLEQEGFTVNSVAHSRNRIVFSGTAAQVASAFGTSLHYYKTPANGTQPAVQHFAPSSDLTLPSALASVVLSVDNLSDFRPHTHLKIPPSQARPRYTVQGNQAYFLVPPDVETIYNITPAYTQGYNGAGQTIAVVGQSSVVATDITTFQTLLGLTAKAPSLNLVPNTGTSVVSAGDESESDIDLEYSSAIAPGATVAFYYAGNSKNTNVIDALQYVIDNNLAPIVSISYGDCEFDTGASYIASFDTVLAEAATQGQSVIASAGDDGSTDCAEDTNLTFAEQTALAVDYPGSSPYVTSMGGTEFPAADVTPVNTTYWTSDPNTTTDLISSAISYIPEQVWNDDEANLTYAEQNKMSPLSAGGGGASLYETRPSWQTGVPGIPSGTTRLVPDIALAASPDYPGYLYCTSDTSSWNTGQTASCADGAFSDPVGDELYYNIAGGTSFDAPIFSGLLAIINQAKGYTPKGQGLVNPTLYTLAANATTYASAFHDITSGGNECDAGATYCGTGDQTTEFQSGTGYDEASGLGSLNFDNLLTAWPTGTATPGSGSGTGAFTLSLSPSTATVAPGASTTGTITITPTDGYTGTVNLTATTLTNGCVVISPTAATISGTSAATATYTIYTSSTATACTSAAAAFKTSAASASLNPHAAPHRPNSPWRELPVSAALAGTILLAGFGRRSRLMRSKLLRAGMALGLLLAFSLSGLGLTGCSGSSTSTSTTATSPTTPATEIYTITITGKDTKTATTTASATFTLTVS